MSITATGPFLLALALYVLVVAPHRLPYFIVFFVPFSATAVINFTALGYKSGGLGLTPAMLFLLCYFGAQLGLGLAGRTVAVSTGLLIQVLLLGAFVLSLLSSGVLNGLTEGLTSFELTQTVYVVLGVAATVTLAFEFCRNGAIEQVVSTVRAAAIFSSLWGIVQVVCFYTGIPYPSILFNNSLSDFANMFDQSGTGFVRIASVAVEPSFFAASLLHFLAFGITIVVCEPRLRTRGWIVPVILCTLVLLGCTSSTGYFGLAVLAVVLLIRSPLRSMAIGAVTAVVLIPIGLSIPKVAAIAASATIDKSQSISYYERAQGTIEAFEIFLKHPLFGGGWGAGPSANAITAMLADVGLVGTTVFLVACIATLFELQSRRSANLGGPNWRLSAYAAGVQNALIVAFACAVTSGIKYVVLDDWCFWALAMAISSKLPRSVHSDHKWRFPQSPDF